MYERNPNMYLHRKNNFATKIVSESVRLCAVWDTHVTSDIQKFEMVQRRATRFVVRNYSRVYGTVTNILNWIGLAYRNDKNSRLSIMYKIHTNNVAIPIPEYVQRQTMKSTRQYHPMKVSTNVYKYSYFPRNISDLNSLPSSVSDSNTIEGFKTALYYVQCN